MKSIVRFLGIFSIAIFCAIGFFQIANAVTLKVMAADALPKPMMEISKIFEKEHPGVKVDFDFMGAGVLKGDIEEGAPCDIFLSANAKFQRELQKRNFLKSYKIFAYDYLAAATPESNPAKVNKENLIKKLMDPSVKLATSSPNTDPAGDYTWKMFEIINHKIPGAFNKIVNHDNHMLDAALVMPALVNGDVDLAILYTSQLVELQRSGAKINIIPINKEYNTKAKFTVAILNQSKYKKLDADFTKLLFSKKGQEILNYWGFTPTR